MGGVLIFCEDETVKKKLKAEQAITEQDSVSSNGATSHTYEASSSRGRVPTDATLKALEERKAATVTRFDDEEDLFRKLGIKLGKG